MVKKHVTRVIAAAWLLVGVATATGQSIECVGTLGNSGVAGGELLQTTPHDGPAGLAWDDDTTLWISGGDAILHVSVDGRLLKRYPLGPDIESVRSWAFAPLNGTLYFFARATKPTTVTKPTFYRSQTVLAALPMKAGARVRIIKAFPDVADSRSGCLAAQPMGKDLLLAQAPPPGSDAKDWRITAFNPAGGAERDLFTVPAQYVSGLAYDADRKVILVGGNYGRFVAARNHHPKPCELVIYDLQGKEQSREVVIATEAIPSEYRACISLVGDSIWDVAWYGFLARLNSQFQPDPGTIRAWNLEIGYPSQVVGTPFPTRRAAALQPVALSTHGSLHVYVGHWDVAARQLRWTSRIGALPGVRSVALSDDGWVTCGGAAGQLWWRWEDAPASPPRFGNNGQAMAPGSFHRAALIAPQQGRPPREKDQPTPVMSVSYSPATARNSADPDHGNLWPLADPVGLVLLPDSRPGSRRAWTVSASTGALWHAPTDGRTGYPRTSAFAEATLDSPPGPVTSMTSLGENRLVVARRADKTGRAALAVFDISGSKAAPATTWPTPADGWGEELHIAGADQLLWISDSARHRVLLLDGRSGQMLARFGGTGAGGDISQLSQPRAIAAAGVQAVVYDSGNQRLVKLRWHPAKSQ